MVVGAQVVATVVAFVLWMVARKKWNLLAEISFAFVFFAFLFYGEAGQQMLSAFSTVWDWIGELGRNIGGAQPTDGGV